MAKRDIELSMGENVASQVKSHTARKFSLRYVDSKSVGNTERKMYTAKSYLASRPTCAVNTLQGNGKTVFSGMRGLT